MRIMRPVRATDIGMRVLRCRLSLKETQDEFAARFRAAGVTISRWERGDVETIHAIYREILDGLESKLKDEKLLVPMELVEIVYKTVLKKRGDAEHPYPKKVKAQTVITMDGEVKNVD